MNEFAVASESNLSVSISFFRFLLIIYFMVRIKFNRLFEFNEYAAWNVQYIGIQINFPSSKN